MYRIVGKRIHFSKLMQQKTEKAGEKIYVKYVNQTKKKYIKNYRQNSHEYKIIAAKQINSRRNERKNAINN